LKAKPPLRALPSALLSSSRVEFLKAEAPKTSYEKRTSCEKKLFAKKKYLRKKRRKRRKKKSWPPLFSRSECIWFV
jgi:hypothetical protein